MYFFSILIPLILIYPSNKEASRLMWFKAERTHKRSSHTLIGIIFVSLLMPSMTHTYYIYRDSKLSLSSFTFYHDPMREFVNSLNCFDESGRIYLVSDTYGDWVTTHMNSYLPKSERVQFFVSNDNSHWIRWTRQRAEVNISLQKNEATLVKKFLEEKHECLIIQDLLHNRFREQFRNYSILEATSEIHGYLKPNRFLLLRKANS
jgi:hypothetical protein